MTNNTIPNVPRELLADLLGNDHDKRIMAERHLLAMLANAPSPADHVEDVRAMVADPSPDGVDVLEVVAWRIGLPNNAGYKVYEQRQPWAYEQYGVPSVIVYEVQELCRLSDATAIIDGLRGEVAQLQSMLATVSKAGIRIRTERDQQAQRIGELEGLLYEASGELRTDRHHGLGPRIDAALSAVCAAAPNIATTSEHSGS